MEEADDLNYDEPQNMDDGWDGDEMEGEGTSEWNDAGMSPKGNVDEGWDDDDEGDDGWGAEEDADMADTKESSTEEVVNGYVVIRDPDVQLQKELDRVISEVGGVLFVEKGQAEIALRDNKWKKNALETAWFANDDAPNEHRKRLGLTRRPDEWEEQPTSTKLKCCSYSGGSDTKGSGERSRQMKSTQKELYNFVSQLMKSGENRSSVIRMARAKKFKIQDVMQMCTIVTSEMLGPSLGTAESGCSKTNGTFTLDKGARLNCGHGRCDECWAGFCKAAVQAGNDALTARCNTIICNKNHQHKYIEGCFCGERIPREIFEKYLKDTPKLLEKYRKMCLDSFVSEAMNFNLRPCPSSKCKLWYKKKVPKSEIITCECTQRMCFHCGLPPHQPIPCSNALDWKKRSSSDVQTQIYIMMNTASCPNPECGVVIKREIDERDRCLHMICSQCKYHWCWACREEFRPGGKNKNHDNFYHCRLYDEGKLRPEVKEQNAKLDQIRREAAKYKWCEHLLGCCDRDIKSLEKLQKTLETKVSVGVGEGGKYKFLFDAISKLIMANEDKKKLYIVAFYAAMDNKKQLFEFQLKDMAEKTTNLLNMLHPQKKEHQKTLEDFERDGKQIHSSTKIVSAFLQKLRRDVQDGECVTILDKPDDKSTGWFCMACKKMNPFDRFVCECTACQVHGEKRCLRCNPEQHVHYID
mmetsp:Transcript_1473/g.2823  ORF Transcript_1473/g.2823 Transcript_1473/m.2823 type:complete len:695 (-) Transcript_1473:221-2305(-)